MRKIILFAFVYFSIATSNGQSVGIGTNVPNTKAALDITSTSKGVLFPRMTSAQRDAISNPPDGLHIYNTDERGLNYYDSVYAIWNSYLDEYKTVIIHITQTNASLNFYTMYGISKPSNRYLVIVNQGVTLLGINPSDTALIFSDMPTGTSITLKNYGYIGGAGGSGGSGRITNSASNPCIGYINIMGSNGYDGGHAISTKPGVVINVTNHGVIAGGGGGAGSGGPGPNSDGYGGGGGGGAGTSPGQGGHGGRSYFYSFSFPPSCNYTQLSSPGLAGTFGNGGQGGMGAFGSPVAGNGGTGGTRGMPGQPGSDNVFQGGAAGKAIGGGSGNSLVNVGTGVSYGAVD